MRRFLDFSRLNVWRFRNVILKGSWGKENSSTFVQLLIITATIIKMRIRVSGNDKEAEVSGSNDVFSLGPATQLLQQIRSEHLYSTPSNCSLDKYCGTEERPSISKDDSQNGITSILDKLKAKTATQNANSSNADGEFDMLTLNAASIQQQFQSMIDLTSFAQLPEIVENAPSTTRVKKVNFVDNLPEGSPENDHTSTVTSNAESGTKTDKKKDAAASEKDKTEDNSNNTRFEKEKILRSSKTSDKTKIKRSKARKIVSDTDKKNSEKTQCKSVNSDDWRSINKALDEERILNLYMKHAAGLLVRRWGEYLVMTSEQIRQFEIQNAKEADMIDEVIEMLEDKDRYVWQLIDELRFW